MLTSSRRHFYNADCVLFVERACELQYAARLSCVSGAEAKASLNRAT
jgi:hypothetical protein